MRFLIFLFIASLAITLLLLPLRQPGESAIPRTGPPASPVDSTATGFSRAVRSFSKPALEERKASRRALQRAGYADVVAGLLRLDAAAALGSLIRMNAQVEFRLSHRPLYLYIPVTPAGTDSLLPPSLFFYRSPPMAIELSDDWSMPEDPWK